MRSSNTLWIIGILLLLGGGGYAVYQMTRSWLQNKNASKYLPLLNAAEDKYNIPRNLLARQAYQESRFRDDIVDGSTVSPAGALGIMQIVPKYHPDVNPLDTPAAIDYAAAFMQRLYNQFGTWSLALAAYNAGPGNVKKYSGIPPFAETQNYVNQILNDLIDPANPASKTLYA